MNQNNEIKAYLALCSKLPGLRFSETALRVVKDGIAYCTTCTPRTRRWQVELATAMATEVRR